MRITLIICLLFALGCGTTELPSPEVSARAAELSALLTSTKSVETTQDTILTAIEANTVAISEVKTKVESLEASLIVPKVEPGKEVIKSALEPAPVVNASSGAGPGRLASDGTRLRWNVSGNWNPTILETSSHLAREHGINTDGMTHQQMADLHADLHDGKTSGGAPVGSIFPNNRTSAVTSQRTSVRSLPQRVRFVGRSKYQTFQSCPSGRCPTR